jgi:hypothetical protein
MNVRLLALPILLAALTSGCAISNQTYGPTGKVAHTISCKGAMNSISNCFDKAGDICGKLGYDLLMQEGTATPFGIASGYANSSGGSFSGFGGTAVSRSIMVQCKAPAA